MLLFGGEREFTFSDVMRFQKISENGKWVSYCTYPDRGNTTAYIKSTITEDEHFVERGTSTLFSNDTKWAAIRKKPDIIEQLNSEKEKDKPKNSLTILNLETGLQTDIKDVNKFEFTEDSRWIVFYNEIDPVKHKELKSKTTGKPLVLRHLVSGTEIVMEDVIEYAL
jgi:hypothetical protein